MNVVNLWSVGKRARVHFDIRSLFSRIFQFFVGIANFACLEIDECTIFTAFLHLFSLGKASRLKLISKAQTHGIEIFKINHFCGKTLHTSKNQEIEEKHPIHFTGAFDSFIESQESWFSCDLCIFGIFSPKTGKSISSISAISVYGCVGCWQKTLARIQWFFLQ